LVVVPFYKEFVQIVLLTDAENTVSWCECQQSKRLYHYFHPAAHRNPKSGKKGKSDTPETPETPKA